MKAAYKKQIMNSVNYLKDLMFLKDWTIVWDDDLGASHCSAMMSSIRGTKSGQIWFNDTYLGFKPKLQREIAVHELIHFHLEGAANYVMEHAPTDEYEAFIYLQEFGVDALAEALAPHLPLPKFQFT